MKFQVEHKLFRQIAETADGDEDFFFRLATWCNENGYILEAIQHGIRGTEITIKKILTDK